MKSIKILDIPIHSLSFQQALDALAEFIASQQPHQITTVNPEFILEAQHNPEFRKILQGADLSLADGAGIMWAARYQGRPLLEKIPGADLTYELARLAAGQGWSIYLVGGGEGIAVRAAEQLQHNYPKLKIVGAESGITKRPSGQLFDQTEVDQLISRIRKAKPDILLVAFGAPKQELFINRYKKELGVPVMIGVGGTFDYLAGRVSRAPEGWRQFNLEWLWRLLQQPKRLRRIFKAVIVFPMKVIFSK